MAKDPAFLFYPGDWLSGTMGMTFDEKGAYFELLMLQFNRGHMTTDMIGRNIGQLWVKVQDKFIQDKAGLWYNVRLEEEQIKRKNFVSTRKNNLSGENQYTKKQGHKAGHMTSHMENVNEDVNEDKNVSEKKGDFNDLFLRAFDEITCERLQMTFKNIPDLGRELQMFRTKCDNAPGDYHRRDLAGLRLAFQYQLKNYKNGNPTATDKLADIDRIVKERFGFEGAK
jgi:uncharacterized protein YdaU (DUF1376 family)